MDIPYNLYDLIDAVVKAALPKSSVEAQAELRLALLACIRANVLAQVESDAGSTPRATLKDESEENSNKLREIEEKVAHYKAWLLKVSGLK